MPPDGGILRPCRKRCKERKMTDERQLKTLPVIPLRGMTIMPDTIIHFDLNRDRSIQALESAMIRHTLRQGYRPFCQVETENEASMSLQKKLGLTPAPDPVVWCWRPHEDGEADQ